MSGMILAILLAICAEVQAIKENGKLAEEHYGEGPFKSAWFNRDPEYLKRAEVSKRSNNEYPPAPEVRELTGDAATCQARLDRFTTINDISTPKVLSPTDPNFPAEMVSIAADGATCGDSAAGISDSCSQYNHWSDMKDINQAMFGTPSWTIFNATTNMPAPEDVSQGALGNCYFLSAILSIAYQHPELIKDMFVRTDLWANNTITTKWLVNGVESYIAVDTKIPAYDPVTQPGYNNQPYFTEPVEPSKAWWPAILGKAWAKIFGSYQATEAGYWSNAAAAITRAPTEDIYHASSDKTTLWNKMVEATANKWPMGAGTVAKHYGLAAGHAYGVYRAYTDTQYGQVVEVRNPWHVDHYSGSVPNPTNNDGLFVMTFDEYFTAFSDTGIAKVGASYYVTSTQLTSANSFEASYKFTVTTASPFYVAVTWPSARLLKPCTATPSYSVLVEKQGSSTAAPVTNGGNTAFAASTGGNGSYRAAVSIKFPSNSYITSAYMTIYAAEHITLYTSTIPYPQLALGMVGASVGGNPCETVTMNSNTWTVDYSHPIAGVATYWDGSSRYASFISSKGQWAVQDASDFATVASTGQPLSWYTPLVSPSEITCGCKDSPTGVSGFSGVPCSKVKAPNYQYSNVRCDVQVEYTASVESSCPVTCGLAACSVPLPQPLPENPAPAPGPAPTVPGPITALPAPAPGVTAAPGPAPPGVSVPPAPGHEAGPAAPSTTQAPTTAIVPSPGIPGAVTTTIKGLVTPIVTTPQPSQLAQWEMILSPADEAWALSNWAVLEAALIKAIAEVFGVATSQITLTGPAGGRRLTGRELASAIQIAVKTLPGVPAPDPFGHATDLQQQINADLPAAHKVSPISFANYRSEPVTAPPPATYPPTTTPPPAPIWKFLDSLTYPATTTPATYPATSTPPPNYVVKFAVDNNPDVEMKRSSFLWSLGLFGLLLAAVVVGVGMRMRAARAAARTYSYYVEEATDVEESLE